MLPLIAGVVGRAIATKAIQRGAVAALGRSSLSAAQFARGASIAANAGRVAAGVGRGAMLTANVLGHTAISAIGQAAKINEQNREQSPNPDSPNFSGGY